MNSNRRSFLKRNILVGGGLLLADSLNAVAIATKTINTNGINRSEVHIMYTNDLLGTISSNHQNLGGLRSLRDTLLNEEISSLLFDAGGFLNPNQNFDQQLNGIDLMNKINYHGVNLSAADLNKGIEYFASLLPYINFQLLSCNYLFDNASFKKRVNTYQILTYGKFKIGVTGVGEEVSIKGLKVLDSEKSLKQISEKLKNEMGCDLIICLSHLGFNPESNQNNKKLAASSSDVDLIIGGNAKKENNQLWVIKNSKKEDVLISNNYSKGLSVAKINYRFDLEKRNFGFGLKRYIPGLTNRADIGNAFVSLDADKKIISMTEV